MDLGLRSLALQTLLDVLAGDIDLAKRVRQRLAVVTPIRPIGWKDRNPRSVIGAIVAESGKAPWELSQPIHIDGWTALSNYAAWYPNQVIALMDAAIKQMESP